MHLVAILIRKMMRSTEMPNLWIPFSNWQNGLIGDASTEWRCSYKWVEAQSQIRCRVRVVAGRPAVSKSLLKPRSSTSAEQIRVKPSYIVFSSSSSSSSLLSLISPPDELWSAGHKSVLTEHLLKCLGWSNLPLRTNICWGGRWRNLATMQVKFWSHFIPLKHCQQEPKELCGTSKIVEGIFDKQRRTNYLNRHEKEGYETQKEDTRSLSLSFSTPSSRTPNPLYLLIFKKNKEKETICI